MRQVLDSGDARVGVVTADLMARARAGDNDAFRELTEPYGRELHVHCYRMLGSFQDAEDALQDTLLTAWQGLGGFEGRASVRTWLYRIATNRCLNALRSASRRPAREWDIPGVVPPAPTRLGDVVWLEPYPDALLEGALNVPLGPEARYEQTEAICLAFVTALQVLPARQRAVLILREVLGYHANEVADMLESTVESVTSALKRARASVQRRRPPTADRDLPPAIHSPSEGAIVAKFDRAYESADLDALVALLTDDVFMSMPPMPLEYEGRDVVARFFANIFGAGRRFDLVPTRANGQPAFGAYLRVDAGIRHGTGLFVLTLSGDRICGMTRFEDSVLPWFGLPRSLPSRGGTPRGSPLLSGVTKGETMVVATGAGQVLEQAVQAGDVAGVVALAANEQGVIYHGAFGKRAQGGDVDMTLDTVMWIASMTKAITSVAAMQLVEQGRITLDEPLSAKIPELGSIQVLDGFDEAGAPKLRAPRRPITLRHLLTHTAGFTYDIWNADMVRYQEHAGVPGIIECKTATLMTPLMFDPGDRWEYGINIDWVGQTVERLSGQRIEEYFKEHISGPLGMRDTGFVLGASQRERLAGMHARLPDGSLQVIPFEMPQEPEFYMGGGGLYSTGPDYLRFLQMLLGNGQLDGVRVLAEETVAEMGRNQIGDLTVGVLKTVSPNNSNDAEFFPGMPKKWGLAYMINAEDAPVGRTAGSLAWAGLANTYFWIDPTRRVAGVILSQSLPFADARVLALLEEFERAIYATAA
jgi:RNA polymerase sigma-70 factor (TIGR02960 family)